MDLNAKVDVNFAMVEVNFQTVAVTYFCYNCFCFFLYQSSSSPTNTPYKISAKYTKPFWRNGLKYPSQRHFFRVDVNFQTAIVA